MDTLTRAQLVYALTQYYQAANDTPENFGDVLEGTAAEHAEGAASYIFEIVQQANV